MYVSVVIDNSSTNVDNYYEYEVPCSYASFVKPGERCIVQFGKANRQLMGYILDVYENKQFEGETKEILELLDYEPVLSREQIALAQFIKNDTISPLSRILNLMIPSVMRAKTKKYLTVLAFDELEAPLMELFGGKTTIPFSNTLEQYQKSIDRALKKKILTISYDTYLPQTVKTITKYQLNVKYYLDNKTFLKSKLNKEILEKIYRRDAEYLSLDEMIDYFEMSEYMVKKLAKEGFLKTKKVVVRRIKELDLKYDIPNLTEYPTYIGEYEKTLTEEKGPFVWVSNSYEEDYSFLKYIVLKNKAQDKQTLVLVPNILSSYKIKSVIRKTTKLNVACLNSNVRSQEIYDYYEMINNHDFDVIVTTPFGALWPYENLGTIVMMDIENDSYRNDQSPRYDLNVVMKKRSELLNTPLIRHMVVPTLKVYSEVMLNHEKLLEKKENTLQTEKAIIVIDMKKEKQNGNNSPLSENLKEALTNNVMNNKHSLLILNNKGYSKFVMCRNCGQVIECPECHTPMQYYQDKETTPFVKCPVCNKKETFTGKCPKCGSSEIRHIGYGMERLKEEVERKIPGAKCGILSDASYEGINDIMIKLSENEINIVIASDIYSRSLIDDDLTVVGIIALDIMASAPNYNAHDVSYSMLEHAKMQLASYGKLIIQTYDTNYNFLSPFITNDYNTYFDSELSLRSILKTEPIYEVNRILVKDNYPDNFKVAGMIKRALYETSKGKNLYVMGPVYNKTDKSVQLTIKHQNKQIAELYKTLYKMFQNEKTLVIFDRYPKYFT